jgi:CheY-like chemotaxis protein
MLSADHNGGGAMSSGAKREQPRHVLVVNDTVAILELFQAILEEEGYRVTTDGFSTENTALLQRVKELNPTLIILDLVVVDEKRGWQFLQMLKMERRTAHIPVIICTAAAKLVDELQVHLDTLGVGVVLKPFEVDVLLRAVAYRLATESD